MAAGTDDLDYTLDEFRAWDARNPDAAARAPRDIARRWLFPRWRPPPGAPRLDELVQECMVRFYSSLRTAKGTVKLARWVIGIARHVRGTHIRQFQSAKGKSAPAGEAVDRLTAREKSPEEAAEAEDAIARLRETIARLPETQRCVLELHLQEKAKSEIAELLGISEGAVRERLRRARARLADLLGRPAPC